MFTSTPLRLKCKYCTLILNDIHLTVGEGLKMISRQFKEICDTDIYGDIENTIQNNILLVIAAYRQQHLLKIDLKF